MTSDRWSREPSLQQLNKQPPVRVCESWVHLQRVQVQVQVQEQKTREEEVQELTSSRLVSGVWLWWKTHWSRVHFLLWVCCQGGRCVCAHLCACACEGQSKCKAPYVYQPLNHLLNSEFWVLSLMCLSNTHKKISVCMNVYGVCVCVCVISAKAMFFFYWPLLKVLWMDFMAALEKNLKWQPPETRRCTSGHKKSKSFKKITNSPTKKLTF